MKNRIATIGVLLFLGFGIPAAHAQQAITPAGGNASGSGGTVSYTVGQLVYTTQSDAKGTLAQGVQQPFELLVMTGMDNPTLNLTLTAYPNPTSGALTLHLGSTDLTTSNFELYDISGKLLETRKITGSTETICMDHLPAATYFLKVTTNDKEVKSFKITKN